MLPVALELQLKRPSQPLTDGWQHLPVERRGSTRLGISFRPRQAEALGLDVRSTLRDLLTRPFQIVRLGAYWNRVEPRPGALDFGELDWQIEAAERAGKQIILCVGALKTFGYPEFFVPKHRLVQPLPEGRLIRPADYPALLAAAIEHIVRIVERYRGRAGIVAWQVEHEAVDPLGLEHSWRLDAAFVEQEVAAVRTADPVRPILMNGFFQASSLVGLAQWWQTRDQGDSLTVAQRIADVVGVDYYPRHALLHLGGRTLYVDGSRGFWHGRALGRLLTWARASSGRRFMITEGQAEPWEAVTTPPSPRDGWMHSCGPEQMIENYNRWQVWTREAGVTLDAYLFWGAEYWMLRQQHGDASYVRAFERILEQG
jgi:hypothetical protein